MIRIFTFVVLLATVFIAKANNYIESFNVISDNYVNDIYDVQIIRPINGGTVIIPIFDESCSEEMKAPFSYACKIVEEYMPPCLPLKVKVSCGRVNGSSANTISKVLARSKENFGTSVYYNNAQMSVIKGVVLSELCYNSTVTYLDSVPDVEFLTKDPDIEITYNNQKLNEISFSLDANPGSNYDFVSLAVRDILIGLGISSSYRYNPVTKELLDPSHELTPFEYYINKMLGNYGNPSTRLAQATKGELLLQDHTVQSLRLYAPNTWKNGSSLNYFIPQDDCCVSNILSYNFCKGMVTRSLSDNYSHFIFYELLGWRPNYVTGNSGASMSIAGSSSLLMPYNGSISFNDNTYGINTIISSDSQHRKAKASNIYENEELIRYIDSFKPFLYSGDYIPSQGISISVLKKDGSWDLVKCLDNYIEDMPYYMSDWDFHYDESQYARTIDGYLRARITIKKPRIETGTGIEYISKFFVIDYLPQKVNLSYVFVDSNTTRVASLNNTARIYFANTEGINRIVLEKLRQGSRVPSKIEITDFKKGYYETNVDKTTTFTAVGYNSNGTSRGVSITIEPQSKVLSLDFKIVDNFIYLESDGLSDLEYSINSLDISTFNIEQMGSTSGIIDISSLSNGLYVLVVRDNNSGLSNSFKFKR